MIEPFQIAIPPEQIEDLRARLRATRFPQGVTDSGGLPLDEVRRLLEHWRDDFDWARQERELNRRRHFRTEIAGLRVHFIHERCARPEAIPLLLLHGWPGSFVEMLEVIPRLAESFHVVVPSLPGYGFSDPAPEPGMSNARIAEMMAELMARLGYPRFAVQGGDWGAGISTWMGLKFPERLLGVHLNYIPGSYVPFVDGEPTAEEEAFLRSRAEWLDQSGAYGRIQGTRPLTLGYALSDSPAGLAAWIVEKFHEWAAPDSRIPDDTLLTNVTLYWVTNTITSSMRLYLESARTPLQLGPGQRVTVPCAVARFPHELPSPPRSWVERGYNLVRWTEMPRGGHFAALEAPDLFARDVTEFLAGLGTDGAGKPRAGWDEAFEAMARQGDEALLDGEGPVPTRWDEEG
jgi:pimeloyl-ACP methyl ester carboxylesterase